MNIAQCRRWSREVAIAALAVVACAPLAAVAQSEAAGELKNVAVIAGAPYEKLIGDITFLGSLGGKPELGQMVEGGLAFFTQGKGSAALDKKQAWGLIVQTDGGNFLPVGCLPVTKPQDLLDVAKAYGAEIKDGEGGTKEIKLPNNSRSVFVKIEDGMAFISMSPASLGKLPANPKQQLTKMVGEYDITVHASVKNIPEMYRQFALNAMQAGVQQGMKKNEDETDEQYEQRQKMTEAQMAQMSRMVNEIDALTIGWAVDSKQARTYADFTYTFIAGSKMAKQMAAYSSPKTNFAGFFDTDAAATLSFAAKGDPSLMAEDMAQLEANLAAAKQQMNGEIDKKVNDEEAREALKSAMSDWFDAFTATVKTGEMDGGAALHLAADSLTFVAGAHIEDTAKIESGLKKLEEAAKKSPNFPGIEWNAAEHAGVKFHTMKIPVPESEAGPRKLLGEELNVAIGIGSDAVYLAVGEENLKSVNEAIDDSAKEKGKSVPPFEFALSLAPIMETAAAQAEKSEQKEICEKVAEFLKNNAQGRDHVRAVGQIVPNGLKYHFEAEEGVLKAIGTAAQAAQQQKMQAQQQQ